LSQVDTWHACPCHHTDQPHPEDDYDYDEVEATPEGKAVTGYRMGTPIYEDVETCDPDADDLPF